MSLKNKMNSIFRHPIKVTKDYKRSGVQNDDPVSWKKKTKLKLALSSHAGY